MKITYEIPICSFRIKQNGIYLSSHSLDFLYELSNIFDVYKHKRWLWETNNNEKSCISKCQTLTPIHTQHLISFLMFLSGRKICIESVYCFVRHKAEMSKWYITHTWTKVYITCAGGSYISYAHATSERGSEDESQDGKGEKFVSFVHPSLKFQTEWLFHFLTDSFFFAKCK